MNAHAAELSPPATRCDGAAAAAPEIERLSVAVYQVPTATPESDGTHEWDHTTMVLVEALAGGALGLGYTYASRAAATVAEDVLAPVVEGRSAFDIRGAFDAMIRAVRNAGRPGVCAMAISAVDVALWDLKARLLGLPLLSLLGAVGESMPIYGSGGFTNYSLTELQDQLRGWTDEGIPRVKMKVGRDARADLERMAAARSAIGAKSELFIDANGGYARKQAQAQAEACRGEGVSWFEEPVSSDDLPGLRLLRDRAPAGMDIAAGEYGYAADDFLRLLQAGAVDVLQADATRCGGITGFLQAAELCAAFHLPLSSHCAPALHLHPACAASTFRHAEYFFDHVRIERLFFEGFPEQKGGALRPDLTAPGHGLALRAADAARFRIPL